MQICINLNPGINRKVDRVNKEKYFTIANAISCIERENVALEALKVSLISFGFLDSSSSRSSSSSSSGSGGVVDYSPAELKDSSSSSSSTSSSISSSSSYA